MSKPIELPAKVIKGLYRTASEADKIFLEEKYGKEFFSAKNILDESDPFAAACEELGLIGNEELPFSNPKNNRQEAANAYVMLDIIAEALRGPVPLDFSPGNKQDKWWPWFNNYKSGSGFRFNDSGHGWSDSVAAGGARLAVYSKEISDEFGVKCLHIWNKFQNPIK